MSHSCETQNSRVAFKSHDFESVHFALESGQAKAGKNLGATSSLLHPHLLLCYRSFATVLFERHLLHYYSRWQVYLLAGASPTLADD